MDTPYNPYAPTEGSSAMPMMGIFRFPAPLSQSLTEPLVINPVTESHPLTSSAVVAPPGPPSMFPSFGQFMAPFVDPCVVVETPSPETPQTQTPRLPMFSPPSLQQQLSTTVPSPLSHNASSSRVMRRLDFYHAFVEGDEILQDLWHIGSNEIVRTKASDLYRNHWVQTTLKPSFFWAILSTAQYLREVRKLSWQIQKRTVASPCVYFNASPHHCTHNAAKHTESGFHFCLCCGRGDHGVHDCNNMQKLEDRLQALSITVGTSSEVLFDFFGLGLQAPASTLSVSTEKTIAPRQSSTPVASPLKVGTPSSLPPPTAQQPQPVSAAVVFTELNTKSNARNETGPGPMSRPEFHRKYIVGDSDLTDLWFAFNNDEIRAKAKEIFHTYWSQTSLSVPYIWSLLSAAQWVRIKKQKNFFWQKAKQSLTTCLYYNYADNCCRKASTHVSAGVHFCVCCGTEGHGIFACTIYKKIQKRLAYFASQLGVATETLNEFLGLSETLPTSIVLPAVPKKQNPSAAPQESLSTATSSLPTSPIVGGSLERDSLEINVSEARRHLEEAQSELARRREALVRAQNLLAAKERATKRGIAQRRILEDKMRGAEDEDELQLPVPPAARPVPPPPAAGPVSALAPSYLHPNRLIQLTRDEFYRRFITPSAELCDIWQACNNDDIRARASEVFHNFWSQTTLVVPYFWSILSASLWVIPKKALNRKGMLYWQTVKNTSMPCIYCNYASNCCRKAQAHIKSGARFCLCCGMNDHGVSACKVLPEIYKRIAGLANQLNISTELLQEFLGLTEAIPHSIMCKPMEDRKKDTKKDFPANSKKTGKASQDDLESQTPEPTTPVSAGGGGGPAPLTMGQIVKLGPAKFSRFDFHSHSFTRAEFLKKFVSADNEVNELWSAFANEELRLKAKEVYHSYWSQTSLSVPFYWALFSAAQWVRLKRPKPFFWQKTKQTLTTCLYFNFGEGTCKKAASHVEAHLHFCVCCGAEGHGIHSCAQLKKITKKMGHFAGQLGLTSDTLFDFIGANEIVPQSIILKMGVRKPGFKDEEKDLTTAEEEASASVAEKEQPQRKIRDSKKSTGTKVEKDEHNTDLGWEDQLRKDLLAMQNEESRERKEAVRAFTQEVQKMQIEATRARKTLSKQRKEDAKEQARIMRQSIEDEEHTIRHAEQKQYLAEGNSIFYRLQHALKEHRMATAAKRKQQRQESSVARDTVPSVDTAPKIVVPAGFKEMVFFPTPVATTISEPERKKNEEIAEASKAKGNQCFQAGDYQKAIQHYSGAIQNAPHLHALYANRSSAYLKLEKFEKARSDAEQAIQLAPQWPRGYQRLAYVLIAQKMWVPALEAVQIAEQLDPSDMDTKELLKLVTSNLRTDWPSQSQIDSLIRTLQKQNFTKSAVVQVASGAVASHETKSSDSAAVLDAAAALFGIVFRSPEHAKFVVKNGGVEAWMQCFGADKDRDHLVVPALMALREILRVASDAVPKTAKAAIFTLVMGCIEYMKTDTELFAVSSILRECSETTEGNKRSSKLCLVSTTQEAKRAIHVVAHILKKTSYRASCVNCMWVLGLTSEGRFNRCVQDVVDSGVLPTVAATLVGKIPARTTTDALAPPKTYRLAAAECMRKIFEYIPNGAKFNDIVFLSKAVFNECVRCSSVLWNKAQRPFLQDPIVVLAALRVIGNVVAGSQAQMRAVLALPDVVSSLHSLLHHTSSQVQREAAWTLSNVVSDADEERQQVLTQPRLLEDVAHFLLCSITGASPPTHSSDSASVRTEVAFIVSGLCMTESMEAQQKLARSGVIVALLQTVHLKHRSPMDAIVAEALENLGCSGAGLKMVWDNKICKDSLVDNDTNPRPTHYQGDDGYLHVFRDDDPEELRSSLPLQIHAFHLSPQLLAVHKRGPHRRSGSEHTFDFSNVLSLLGIKT